MPMIYRYVRHSMDIKDQPNSREAQLAAISDWITRQAETNALSGYSDGGEFYDPDTSATIPFTRRTAGSVLMGRIKNGDIIVAAKWDRAFRSIRDGVNTLHRLEGEGASLICLDFNIDTRTAAGFYAACQMMLIAEFERRRCAERTREGLRAAKYNHGVVGGGPPTGWKYADNPEHKRKDGRPYKMLVPDEEERAAAMKCVELIDKRCWNLWQAAKYFRRNNGHELFPNLDTSKWSWRSVKIRYLAAKKKFPGRKPVEPLMVAVPAPASTPLLTR